VETHCILNNRSMLILRCRFALPVCVIGFKRYMAAAAQRVDAILEKQIEEFGLYVEAALANGGSSWEIKVPRSISEDVMKAYVANLNKHSKYQFSAIYSTNAENVAITNYGEETGDFEVKTYRVCKLSLVTKPS